MKYTPSEVWNKLQVSAPLIYHLTNVVSVNFSANTCYAIGASPIMSLNPEEAECLAGKASGIVINMGTPTKEGFLSMEKALNSVAKDRKPVLFDPVGYGLTPFRTSLMDGLLGKYSFSIIKGNCGEMSLLSGGQGKTWGVDSVSGDDPVVTVKKVAKRFKCVAVVTGKKDLFSDGNVTWSIEGGSSLLASVTGAGCATGSILCSCAAACEDSLSGAFAGLLSVAVASERAEISSRGPGSFVSAFIDELSLLKPGDFVNPGEMIIRQEVCQ